MRTFGIELEYHNPYRSDLEMPFWFSEVCKELGLSWWQRVSLSLEQRSWTIHAWGMKGEHCGVEINSPICSEIGDIRDFVELFSDILWTEQVHAGHRFLGPKTGFHVHVSVEDLDEYGLTRLLGTYRSCQKWLHAVHPAFRENGFADELTWRNSDIDDCCYKSRALDFHAINSYGTVEFRRAATSLDPRDIFNWILMCRGFVDMIASTDGVPTFECPGRFLDALGVDDGVQNWYYNREKALTGGPSS